MHPPQGELAIAAKSPGIRGNYRGKAGGITPQQTGRVLELIMQL
jgi:hypothetical protein